MRISIRGKIFFAFTVFLLFGGAIWYLNFSKHHLLNQKLEIIEKKDTLLNIILEARRYEKNYFLYLKHTDLTEAHSYISHAEELLTEIIDRYGKDVLSRDLPRDLRELNEYKQSLAELSDLHKHKKATKLEKDSVGNLLERRNRTRGLGKKITANMEQMVFQERGYINRLIKEARLYHFMTMGAMLILSISTVLFLLFSVNRPLKAIETAINKIVGGDYVNIPRISTGDEFESLVISLNNMINELNRRSEQMIQTKKLASLGALTSGVAHELNNPLNNISTSIQILLEEIEDDDLVYKKELLAETETQVERARDIVKALLEFSRKRSFTLNQVHFKDLVNNTIKLIKGELPPRVKLEVEILEDIEANIAPRRIQQVLLNLIFNAIQAMEGKGHLKIMSHRVDKGDEFCFLVQDNGKGIPAKTLPKIFDPFFTTSETDPRTPTLPAYQGIIEQQGTGLGLSICHGIVEQHGGRIEVESKLDEGTTFTVYLPLWKKNGYTA